LHEYASGLTSGPDLSISYVGLSLGSQDPRGPPANCGEYRTGLDKLVQQRSHWKKTKNTSELQNQCVVSNTVR